MLTRTFPSATATGALSASASDAARDLVIAQTNALQVETVSQIVERRSTRTASIPPRRCSGLREERPAKKRPSRVAEAGTTVIWRPVHGIAARRLKAGSVASAEWISD